ncbi:unnamed protein product [Penicillium olsonii]|nr:unnamed protein product [Penicillium olsonii]
MPYPRPVSPLSLETCASPPHGDDFDDFLGSDDELDTTSRVAKRQRIEKLAESYLQGKPLFILSASLKGPLDEEWRNPWKKNRKNGARTSESSKSKIKGPERVAKETDLRAPKLVERLPIGSREPEIPASSLNYIERASVQPGIQSSSRSQRRDPEQSASRSGRGASNGVSRSPAKSSAQPCSPAKDQSPVPPRTADWLKKDRRLMNFTNFEPPSSPTASISSRHSDKSLRPPTRSVQVQVPQTPASPTKPRALKKVPPKTVQSSTKGHSSPKSAHTSASTSHQVQSVSKQSPLRRTEATEDPPSLRIVNSSSQLPRFEYRRCHAEKSKSPMDDESILQEETILHGESTQEEAAAPLSPSGSVKNDSMAPTLPNGTDKAAANPSPTDSTDVQASKPGVSDSPKAEFDPTETCPQQAESQKTLSKDLRFAENTDIVNEDNDTTFQGTAPSTELDQNTTEPNTYDDLPSAQRVPAPLGASDRITSLHSTALPKADTDIDSSVSPETQLSTQAALSHAQKSFQDDLDSPAYYATTPGQNKAIHSPSGTYSANVTPFYRIEESIRRDLEQASLSADKDRMQAMNTQFMLDAATPFNFSTEPAGQDRSWNPINKNATQTLNTQFMLDAASPYAFSTEKKPRAARPASAKRIITGSKRKQRHDASSSASPKSDSTNVEYEYHSAQSHSSGNEASPSSAAPKPGHESTNLPSFSLDLDEATPVAGQDGQGVNQAVETFNLSQAIADAGSWLKQSFDFMKDTGQPSQSSQRHSLNMDLS